MISIVKYVTQSSLILCILHLNGQIHNPFTFDQCQPLIILFQLRNRDLEYEKTLSSVMMCHFLFLYREGGGVGREQACQINHVSGKRCEIIVD